MLPAAEKAWPDGPRRLLVRLRAVLYCHLQAWLRLVELQALLRLEFWGKWLETLEERPVLTLCLQLVLAVVLQSLGKTI
jgi:hypothetical protein